MPYRFQDMIWNRWFIEFLPMNYWHDKINCSASLMHDAELSGTSFFSQLKMLMANQKICIRFFIFFGLGCWGFLFATLFLVILNHTFYETVGIWFYDAFFDMGVVFFQLWVSGVQTTTWWILSRCILGFVIKETVTIDSLCSGLGGTIIWSRIINHCFDGFLLCSTRFLFLGFFRGR